MADQTRTSGESPATVGGQPVKPGHLPVSEMLFDRPGAASPFGEDVVFPLPADQIVYQLPGESEHVEATEEY
jgi:hypothetical protein